MRKIEKQMAEAVRRKAIGFTNGNTHVSTEGDVSQVYLHGNHIATFNHATNSLTVDLCTLRRWPTSVTKSRLRALGAQLESRKGKLYLDGECVL